MVASPNVRLEIDSRPLEAFSSAHVGWVGHRLHDCQSLCRSLLHVEAEKPCLFFCNYMVHEQLWAAMGHHLCLVLRIFLCTPFSPQLLMTAADIPRLCSGKFTWRMSNFGLFRDMIRVQKIMSPPFSAGDCSLRISVYQSTVGGKEHLSLCLESKVGNFSASTLESICVHHQSCLCSRRLRPVHVLALKS